MLIIDNLWVRKKLFLNYNVNLVYLCVQSVKLKKHWYLLALKLIGGKLIVSNKFIISFSQSKDPKAVEYDYETVHNLSIWGCELAPTTREGLRSWNMSVQYWLAACIHRRLPRNLGAMR